jgi:hypothetical protein
MYYSSLLDKEFDSKEAMEKAEAYHRRIKTANEAEKGLQRGAEAYAKQGKDRFSGLRKMFGGN